MTASPPRTALAWEYSPAPEATDHIRLKERYELFVDGAWKAPQTDAYEPTINPATEEPLTEIAQAGDADVDAAVAAAREALPRWQRLPALERGKYVFRIARLIQERARELAIVESLDGGKPIRESRDVDIPLAAAHFFYYAGWADKLRYGLAGRDAGPMGVVGQIVPWNFPLLMAAWKLAPALACGNTAVLKPAETTPLTALLLAEICQEAELPDGVVNIIPGDGSTGAALVRHPGIDKIAFTGSTGVGKDIQAALAGRDVGLTLELGGKSANIVFDDAAIDQAVEGIVNGIFFNQGHVCCAGSRLLLQESVAEEVVEKLWRRMGLLRVGDPLDKNTDVGAINSAEQLQRIEALVDAGEREGATRRTVACTLPERGYWFPPTLFTDVAPASTASPSTRSSVPSSRCSPSAPRPRRSRRPTPTAYGLAAGIWTDKGSRALAVARGLKAGVDLAEHLQPVRPDVAVRRLQGERLRPRGRRRRPAAVREDLVTRLPVVKTYKLYVGGAFARSESGRHLAIEDHEGNRVANAPRGTRKDVRDAVRAARGALPAWQGRTAYNRGQILYRFAEALESRADELTSETARLRGIERAAARAEIEAAVDHAVHYAGWTDKLHAVLGGVNPVAAPHFNFTFPEPTGVVGVIAPEEPDVLGLVAEILPPLAGGNVVVAVVSERWPLLSLHLGEILGVADVPAGVVNLLSGLRSELVKPLAGHRDVDAILDATGDPEVVRLAADSVTRVAKARDDYLDVAALDGLTRIEPFLELKTAWHPVGT